MLPIHSSRVAYPASVAASAHPLNRCRTSSFSEASPTNARSPRVSPVQFRSSPRSPLHSQGAASLTVPVAGTLVEGPRIVSRSSTKETTAGVISSRRPSFNDEATQVRRPSINDEATMVRRPSVNDGLPARSGSKESTSAVSYSRSSSKQSTGGSRPFRILCYGDSNTVGFCQGGRSYEPYGKTLERTLQAAGTACEVKFTGLCAMLAKEMAEKMHDRVLTPPIGPLGSGLIYRLEEEGPFDLVIIMAGTNDLGAFKDSPETILAYVDRLHAACHDRGIPTVNLAPPAVTARREALMRRNRDRLAVIMKSFSTNHRILANLDAEQLVPRSPGLWEKDELHFSPNGSRQLGASVGKHISSIVAELKSSLGMTGDNKRRIESPTSSMTKNIKAWNRMMMPRRDSLSDTPPRKAETPQTDDPMYARRHSASEVPPRTGTPPKGPNPRVRRNSVAEASTHHRSVAVTPKEDRRILNCGPSSLASKKEEESKSSGFSFQDFFDVF